MIEQPFKCAICGLGIDMKNKCEHEFFVNRCYSVTCEKCHIDPIKLLEYIKQLERQNAKYRSTLIEISKVECDDTQGCHCVYLAQEVLNDE